ncbi:substrate-binding domain-containing protein [bacterium]|nr:substrate-binding domain-containing protein [bacterium]RQV92382.1 MAG: LacI family transcriptional regulator [bacterium]
MATLKEIAKRANVSIGTVDRVIHKRGNVSKLKENKIRKIIAELDYKPNLFAQQLQKNKKFTFGVLMPETDVKLGYWPMAMRGINKAISELWKQNIRVTYFHYDANSKESFQKISRIAIQNSIDGLLIAPGLYLDVIRDFVLHLEDNIPYVFFDSPVHGTKSLCDILQDAYNSGWLSAKLMHLLLPNPSEIAIITVQQKGNHLQNRAYGFIQYFQDKPDYKLHTFFPKVIESPMHDIDHLLDKIFQSRYKIDGIFTTNALAYKIVEYISENRPEKKYSLIGYDLTEKNKQYLKEGLIDFIINQKPEIQGYKGIYSLYRHIVLKEPVQSTVLMSLDIVTKENIAYYQEI